MAPVMDDDEMDDALNPPTLIRDETGKIRGRRMHHAGHITPRLRTPIDDEVEEMRIRPKPSKMAEAKEEMDERPSPIRPRIHR